MISHFSLFEIFSYFVVPSHFCLLVFYTGTSLGTSTSLGTGTSLGIVRDVVPPIILFINSDVPYFFNICTLRQKRVSTKKRNSLSTWGLLSPQL